MPEPVLTFDVDWAPDWAIDAVADRLRAAGMRSTWFLTHASPAVDRLRARPDLFELGIHPNLLPGSTHGTTEDEVLRHLLALVPGATIMRTHGLYQTSNFLVKAADEYGIRVDVSLFLPRAPRLVPHRISWSRTPLWRIPYAWEDGAEMQEVDPIWHPTDARLEQDGMRVFDFHPIHVALNTSDFDRYRALRDAGPPSSWTAGLLDAVDATAPGPRTMLDALVAGAAGGGRWIRDLVPPENA